MVAASPSRVQSANGLNAVANIQSRTLLTIDSKATSSDDSSFFSYPVFRGRPRGVLLNPIGWRRHPTDPRLSCKSFLRQIEESSKHLKMLGNIRRLISNSETPGSEMTLPRRAANAIGGDGGRSRDGRLNGRSDRGGRPGGGSPPSIGNKLGSFFQTGSTGQNQRRSPTVDGRWIAPPGRESGSRHRGSAHTSINDGRRLDAGAWMHMAFVGPGSAPPASRSFIRRPSTRTAISGRACKQRSKLSISRQLGCRRSRLRISPGERPRTSTSTSAPRHPIAGFLPAHLGKATSRAKRKTERTWGRPGSDCYPPGRGFIGSSGRRLRSCPFANASLRPPPSTPTSTTGTRT